MKLFRNQTNIELDKLSEVRKAEEKKKKQWREQVDKKRKEAEARKPKNANPVLAWFLMLPGMALALFAHYYIKPETPGEKMVVLFLMFCFAFFSFWIGLVVYAKLKRGYKR